MDPASLVELQQEIADRISEDHHILDQLRTEIRPLRNIVRKIQPRSTTAVSLVGTDGGNNRIEFDPFLIQLVRVVDSSNNEYCLEAITPSTNVRQLSDRQFDTVGQPSSPLGEMMALLGCRHLPELSPMIRNIEPDRPVSPSWVQVYRELVEWAVLLSLIQRKDFGTDTIIVFDGLLRSKVFTGDLFNRLMKKIDDLIRQKRERSGRRLSLVGVAKHSKVLARYRLAMALEGILRTDYAAYVEIPREIEQNAYVWSEYARGDDREIDGGEVNKFVGGKMFFVKFGPSPLDPIWPVDVFLPQVKDAQVIMGCLLADAMNGFPVPCYPQCLQKAHEHAALVDFDYEVLQDQILQALRGTLGDKAAALDILRLQDVDPSRQRYE